MRRVLSSETSEKKKSKLNMLIERLVMDPAAECASKNLELTEALFTDRTGFEIFSRVKIFPSFSNELYFYDNF